MSEQQRAIERTYENFVDSFERVAWHLQPACWNGWRANGLILRALLIVLTRYGAIRLGALVPRT